MQNLGIPPGPWANMARPTQPMSNQRIQRQLTEAQGGLWQAQQNQCKNTEVHQNPGPLWECKPNRSNVIQENPSSTNLPVPRQSARPIKTLAQVQKCFLKGGLRKWKGGCLGLPSSPLSLHSATYTITGPEEPRDRAAATLLIFSCVAPLVYFLDVSSC